MTSFSEVPRLLSVQKPLVIRGCDLFQGLKVFLVYDCRDIIIISLSTFYYFFNFPFFFSPLLSQISYQFNQLFSFLYICFGQLPFLCSYSYSLTFLPAYLISVCRPAWQRKNIMVVFCISTYTFTCLIYTVASSSLNGRNSRGYEGDVSHQSLSKGGYSIICPLKKINKG